MTSRIECRGLQALGLMLGLAIVAACGGEAASDSGADGSDANSIVAASGSTAAGVPAAASGHGTAGMGASAASSGDANAAAAANSNGAAAGGSASAGLAAAGNASPAAAAAAASGAAPGLPSGTAAATGSSGSTPTGAAAASGNTSPISAAGSSASEPAASQTSAGAAAPGSAAMSGADPASCTGDNPSKAPVIYIIGDSTASVYEANLYPRMGWAQPLQEYFQTTCATIQDKALSGRSSKSFLDEGAWAPVRAALREGDFVLIQFGHNDEKSDDAARYTEPFGSYQEHLSMYIDDTLAAKATPILLNSIERNKWSSGKLSATHGDYPEAVRQLAQKRQLTLVDMTQLTHAYLEGLGQAASTKLFMNLAAGESPNYPSGNTDDTHLQEKGAHRVAEIALADLARQRTPIAALLEKVPAP
jgi:lysophospholipase L1-like esterase